MERKVRDAVSTTEDLRYVQLFAILLLCAYYLGINLKPAALVSLSTVAIFYRFALVERFPRRFLRTVLSVVVTIFPLYVFGVEYLRFENDAQGIDFAIYLQSLDHFARYGRLECSLFDLRYHDFLTHHFSPYLYALGMAVRIFKSAPFVAIGAHALGVAAAGWGIYRLVRFFGASSDHGWLSLALILFLPVVRIALLWEVHDETYAIAFVVWAYYAIGVGRFRPSLALLAALCAIKETLLLSVFGFTLAALLCPNVFPAFANCRRARFAFLLMGLAALFIFYLYVLYLPTWFFYPTFRGSQRIAPFHVIFTWSFVRAKIYWALITLAPLAAFFFARERRVWREFFMLSIPAFPLIAAIGVTHFEPMHLPFNYYSVLPLVILFIAALFARRAAPVSQGAFAIAFLVAALVGPSSRLPQDIMRARESGADKEILGVLAEKRDSVFIVDDWKAARFYQSQQPMRLFHARRALPRFDYLIVRPENEGDLTPYLKGWSKRMYVGSSVVIYQALPSKRVSAPLK